MERRPYHKYPSVQKIQNEIIKVKMVEIKS